MNPVLGFDFELPKVPAGGISTGHGKYALLSLAALKVNLACDMPHPGVVRRVAKHD